MAYGFLYRLSRERYNRDSMEITRRGFVFGLASSAGVVAFGNLTNALLATAPEPLKDFEISVALRGTPMRPTLVLLSAHCTTTEAEKLSHACQRALVQLQAEHLAPTSTPPDFALRKVACSFVPFGERAAVVHLQSECYEWEERAIFDAAYALAMDLGADLCPKAAA